MFTTVLEDLAALLRGAGLNASLDAVDVSPPGVVIRADAILPASAKMCGDYPIRSSLLLVVPDTTTLAAYRALDELYARVLPVLAGSGSTPTVDDRVFERLVMPDNSSALPALRLSVITLVPATVPAPTGRNTP